MQFYLHLLVVNSIYLNFISCRNQCEELRGVVSKRECNLVASERMKQLRDKEILAKRKEEEERMYADLWYADIRAKADREEEEARKRMESNRGLLEVLQHQMAAVEAEKKKENDLKYEEAKILACAILVHSVTYKPFKVLW